MNRTAVLLSVVLLATIATTVGAKPPPPPPPPPAYELRMLENEFVVGGFSECKQISNLGDVLGLAQNSTTALPNGTFPATHFVSTPEGRANGIDMASLPDLFQAHLTPAEQLIWQKSNFSSINDSRQVLGSGAYFVDGVFTEWRVIVAQLAVALDGTHAITGFVDLGNNGTPIAINNDGDVLVSPLRVYRAGLGWGAVIPNTTGPYALSNRSVGGTAYIVANSTAAELGLRLTYTIATDSVASTVTLQGPYSRDRSNNAFGVNDSGQVVGEMVTGRSDWRAFLFVGGVMKNLGTLSSGSSWNDSYANGVNSQGNVVGGSFQGSVPGNSGLLYIQATNTTYDSASTLSVDDRATYTSLAARESADINDSGIICGPLGSQPVLNETLSRAYLLLPLP